MQHSIQNPVVKALSSEQRAAALEIARSLAAHERRAWLVGGCVRDLALGRVPKDVDLACAALPEEIEAIFPRTISVGKAFGTIIVVLDHAQVELTSFRSESGYSDGRRPDEVSYGASLEEDARRRDFSCNALYLDPLTDELVDPQGGMADLASGRLRAVGEAQQRFDEDGLRLLRLARFCADLGLEVEANTLEGARVSAERIEGVSGERKLAELERIAALPQALRAIGILDQIGVLARLFPSCPADLAALEGLPPAPGITLLLGSLMGSLAARDIKAALSALDAFKPARSLRRALEEAWTLLGELRQGLRDEGRRSQRILRYRHAGWEHAVALWRATYAPGESQALARLERWCAERACLGPQGLEPELWLKSADLEASGVPRGPRWGEILSRAEELQLDLEFPDRAAALAWLERES